MTICPGARRLGAGGTLNHSMVCTIGVVAPGARFLFLNKRVCQVHTRWVRSIEPVTTSLKEKTSRRHNFFFFRPIEVPERAQIRVF
jgi:hypothetical protein